MLAPMALSLLASAALVLAQGADTGRAAPAVVLPLGPAADAVRAIPADAQPVPLAGPDWPAWGSEAWDGAEPWSRWSELVIEEREAPRPDAGRRAALALAAALQARHVDAWEHFAATAGEPGVAAAVLPRLFPGVPADAPAGRGGHAGALPDGVVLRPVLPPLDSASPYGRPLVREMRLEGLAIGDVVCDVKLAVEADGVELSFVHRAGGTARVRVELPVPSEQSLRAVYVAWEEVPEPPPLIELVLEPGEEGVEGEVSIWGRFEPRELSWPAPAELAMPAQLARGGFVLTVDPGDPLAPRLGQAARSLALLLGVPGGVSEGGKEPPRPRGSAPLTFAFEVGEPEPLRQAKLCFLVSAAERFLLPSRKR
jgi:hypothetical protein